MLQSSLPTTFPVVDGHQGIYDEAQHHAHHHDHRHHNHQIHDGPSSSSSFTPCCPVATPECGGGKHRAVNCCSSSQQSSILCAEQECNSTHENVLSPELSSISPSQSTEHSTQSGFQGVSMTAIPSRTSQSDSLRNEQAGTAGDGSIHTPGPLLTTATPAPSALLPRYLVLNIVGKFYVSADMPIPIAALDIWRYGIKQGLETALDSSSKARRDSDVALQLEFYMAGKKSSNLKPSILITCCSSRRKRELKSCLAKLKWLKESGLPYFVRVD